MSRATFGRYMDRRVASNFKIQITSMVDVFVILLVFLLKSFNTSPVEIAPSKDLTLPSSKSTTEAEDVVKLVVSRSGIFVENRKVVDMTEGKIETKDTDQNDDKLIPVLLRELEQEATRMRSIAQRNEEIKFDGKVLMQADRNLRYDLLQKVMYTSMVAGYPHVKIAVIGD